MDSSRKSVHSGTADDLYFGVLGPVQLLGGARATPLGGPGMRGVLAMLLLNPNEVVPIDEIIDALWGDEVPETARTIVHGYVSRLRRKLGHAIPAHAGVEIHTRSPGYQLAVEPGRVDLHRARELADRARRAESSSKAALMRDALALWRGPALADVPQRARVPELDELRLEMLEERVDADLALGRYRQLVTELSQLTRAHPFRERVIGQLLRALYHCGRRAEALAVYQSFALRAREQLGIDPGPRLRELHERVLHDDLDTQSPDATREPAGEPAESKVDEVGRGTGAMPPRVGVVTPAQLPAAVPSFAGRRAELDWLDGLLASANRIGVLTGVAGVGKSELAVTWAHRVRRRFDGGQLFAAMRGFDPAHSPVSPGDVLTKFLLALGVPGDGIPSDVDDRAALYRSLLADRDVLVVLDDARDSEQVRPLLPAGSGSLTVITSRVRLDGLVARNFARLRVLGTLPLDDATALLQELSGVDGSEDLPEQLARLCDCLPLALRIVAARLAAGRAWTAADLVAELSDEGNRLPGLAVEGIDTSVGAALEVTYRNLSPELASTFRMLGAPSSVTVNLYAAAALQDCDVRTMRRRLRALAENNLITESGEGYFELHDLVRLYARELAVRQHTEDEWQPALDRVLRYYLAAADNARKLLRPSTDGLEFAAPVELPPLESSAQALDWFEAEWANLNVLLRIALRHGRYTEAWQLVRCAHTFRMMRAQREDWLALLELGLSAARDGGDALGEGWMLVSKCTALSRFGLFGELLPLAERATELATDNRLSLAAESILASAWYGQGRYQEALHGYRRALELARAIGDRLVEANQLNNVAQMRRALGEPREAISAQGAALALYRGDAADRSFEMFALGNLAELYVEVGELDTAERYARDAVKLAEEQDSALQEAFGRQVLGQVLRGRGDLADARIELQLSEQRYDQAGSTDGAQQVRAELAEVESRLAT